MRLDSRLANQLRKVVIKKNYLKHAAGSCLIQMGDTHVICSASVDEKVPSFLRGQGKGWMTAEYGMLPGSCTGRIEREATRGKQSGRTQEIQRLIGRSLRSVSDLTKLGERTIILDADVVQGDGGTRTASITGCFIALALAVEKLMKKGLVKETPLRDYVAAISAGIIEGEARLDLCYEEDSKAEVDMNVVMTGSGQFVEIQGTAEGVPFSQKQMDKMLDIAGKGIRQLITMQKKLVSI